MVATGDQTPKIRVCKAYIVMLHHVCNMTAAVGSGLELRHGPRLLNKNEMQFGFFAISSTEVQ